MALINRLMPSIDRNAKHMQIQNKKTPINAKACLRKRNNMDEHEKHVLGKFWRPIALLAPPCPKQRDSTREDSWEYSSPAAAALQWVVQASKHQPWAESRTACTSPSCHHHVQEPISNPIWFGSTFQNIY